MAAVIIPFPATKPRTKRTRKDAQPAPECDAGGYTDLLALLVRDHDATLIITVTGDPMYEAGLYEGDHLIVDTALEPAQGDLVILRGDADGDTVAPFNRKTDRAGVIGVVMHVISTRKRVGTLKGKSRQR